MRRLVVQFIFVVCVLMALPCIAYADYVPRDVAGAAATRDAAETAAEATTMSALIYGGAIILAGVAVGAGIYLGLRHKN
ncbi:MAG: hypothetical protein Q8S43_08120 [Actinomycetota bacterium]|nr:hypothetical protein [Actinomycetota bacterium]MDP3630897.1 hypothetical protein [Actinomycetota bacterium]